MNPRLRNLSVLAFTGWISLATGLAQEDGETPDDGSGAPASNGGAGSVLDRLLPSFEIARGGLQAQADLTALDSSSGDFGIDFRIEYQKNFDTTDLSGPVDAGWSLYDTVLKLEAEGFLTVTESENERDSIKAEAKFGWTGFYTSKEAAAAGRQKLDIDLDADPSRIAQLAADVDSDWWTFGLVTAKYETTQDFEDYDFAFGAEVAVTSAPLAKILDIPFKFLRFGEGNNPRQLDLVGGVDYVTELDQTANAALRGGDFEAWRAYAGVEWSTGIFTARQRIAFRYEFNYELDAPDGVDRAGKDFNQFFEARIQHLLIGEFLGQGTFATLKYTTGELAPNYEGESLVGAGFTVQF